MGIVEEFNSYRCTTPEIQKATGAATLAGGTIVIQDVRPAFQFAEELHHV